MTENVRRRAAGSAILILRSAHAQALPQSRTRVRASRRMRTTTAWPSCFETHRSVTMLGSRRPRSRCDAPQHEGRGRTAHFGETKPMGSMPACSMRNRPAVAGSDRRRRSIVSGLLFTMNGATRTGIWRSSKTLAPAKRGEGGERRRREPGEGQFLATRIRFKLCGWCRSRPSPASPLSRLGTLSPP